MDHPESRRLRTAFSGQRILITGHTGFKGSWLAEWLLLLGAQVTGFSQPPPSDPALFTQLGLCERLDHRLGDVRDDLALAGVVKEFAPHFIFHLAAQALVRASYERPVETYATNVLGTVHLLEAVRLSGRECIIVCITTDKCYENHEWLHAYRETDRLGGRDPYSSSKAAAELVIATYRDSFFSPMRAPHVPVALASVRAGNVVGGGDWARDRILPDCMRALQRDESIRVRNPEATRPWQHVLEPLGGYLLLALALAEAKRSGDVERLKQLSSPFNFGPPLESNRSVAALVTEILKHRGGVWIGHFEENAVHEANRLNLATDKAYHLLGWKPIWGFERTIAETVTWYLRSATEPIDTLTRAQIGAYVSDAAAVGSPLTI